MLGSTGRWPTVVNIWEHDGWDGLAQSFGVEAVGKGAQDPTLEAWWAKAAELRSGGLDRILEPAPWTRTITELCADGVTGETYAHEQVFVQPGRAWDYLELVRQEGMAVHERFGWELAGAWVTSMRRCRRSGPGASLRALTVSRLLAGAVTAGGALSALQPARGG